MGFIFKESHGVLDENFVLETDELHDLFGDPRPNDLQVDLTHVYLCIELGGKLDCFEEL